MMMRWSLNIITNIRSKELWGDIAGWKEIKVTELMNAGKLNMSIEQLTEKNSEVAYTQFIRHHCSFTVRRSLSFDLLPASQLSCPEYLRCNFIARPEYLSIWGATILQDQRNWNGMHLFNFCSKRSWHMYSNLFNKQMSFCPNHLSLVKYELNKYPCCNILWEASVWSCLSSLKPSCKQESLENF